MTVVGAMSQSAILTMQTLGKLMTGEGFKQFVSEHLVPKLWQGAVVMDNLKAHKVEGLSRKAQRQSQSYYNWESVFVQVGMRNDFAHRCYCTN